QVKALFLALIENAPADRAALLDAACAGDAELRQRVEGLLRAHEEPGSFLNVQALDPLLTEDHSPGAFLPPALAAVPPGERPGPRIGPYKLLQRRGGGGMGAVWLAEQREPVRRLVALKVIKAGMDSAQVLARFEAERQALALMDHPHIARVLDAGTTEAG